MAQATVLICDDDAALRGLLREVLAGEGFGIVEAGDGEQSLALARSVRPAVILLDLSMPGRSGLDVLAELSGDSTLAETRVIVLTGSVDVSGARAHGAHRCLVKPVGLAELICAVGEACAA